MANVNATTPIDAASCVTTANAVTAATPALTTTNANDTLLTFILYWAANSGKGLYGPGTGDTFYRTPIHSEASTMG